jgi:glucose-1-phosphate thymidylyltransferase
MNALILAAGYATRLYPLTLNRSKSLLEIAGKPMVERVADQLSRIEELRTVYVVTNAKFADSFVGWARDYQKRRPGLQLKVINDNSTNEADKLGAIGDLSFVLDGEDLYDTGLLVVAGDNLFSDPLDNFANFAARHPATVGVYDVQSLEQAKKYNKITTNPAGILTGFEEKPEDPVSTLCAIALYLYQPETLRLLKVYLEEGNNPDQPGRFIQWLYPRLDVFTFPISGLWYDVGSHETLRQANELFAGR